MKSKQNQIASEQYKDIIVKELEFVIRKMDEAPKLEGKLYFFSAVQGILNRILNLEYSADLLLAYYITNETLKMFQQRQAAFKAGDTAIALTEEQVQKLSQITSGFLKAMKNDEKLDDVLKDYVVLLYSTTGNGYYLMEKGFLKI
jgi:hypothetical protein